MSQGLPPRPRAFGVQVNANTPISVRPRRRQIRGITVDDVTLVTRGPAAFPVQLSRRQQFNFLRTLVQRSPRPDRVTVNLEFRGAGRVLYRALPGTVFDTRNPELGFGRFTRRLNLYQTVGVESGSPLDANGDPLVPVTDNFRIVYGSANAIPPRMIGDDGEGWHAQEEQILAKELLPFANSFAESPSGVHCVDHTCFWLGIPLYSRRANRPDASTPDLVPPTWEEAYAYFQAELTAKYPNRISNKLPGLEHPNSVLYVLGPYELGARLLTMRENFVNVMNEMTFGQITPREILYSKRKWYQALTPSMIFQIKDPERLLQENGPAVIMRGKGHMEFVPTVYNENIRAWVPMIRKQPLGRLYLSPTMKLCALSPKKRLAQEFKALTPVQVYERGFKDWAEVCSANELVGKYEGLITQDVTDDKAFLSKHCNFDTRLLHLYDVAPALKVRKTALGERNVLNIYWDAESIWSVGTSRLRLYSLCALNLTNEERSEILQGREEESFIPQLLNKTKAYYGWECAEDFVRSIAHELASEKYSEIRMITFNGSAFDNFFLAKTMEELAILEQATKDLTGEYPCFGFLDPEIGDTEPWNAYRVPQFTSQFFQGGRLLSATIVVRFMDGTQAASEAVFSDIAKHMPGMSLNACGKAFQTKARKKEGFSHERVQRMYEDNPSNFWNDPELFEELTVYNKLDCIVLFEVEMLYREAMGRLSSVFTMDGGLPLTIGSGVRQHWAKDWEQQGRAPWQLRVETTPEDDERLSIYGSWEPLDEYHWKALRIGIPGGWVNLPNGPQHVEDRLSSLDVKGLYSFIMAMYDKAFYPVGNVRILQVGEIPPAHLYGAYHIDVDMSPLLERDLVTVLPEKVFSTSGALLRNNWNAPVVNSTWVSTPILRILQNFRCNITYRGGVVYSNYVRGYDLFKCLIPFLKEKKRQDQLKGTPEYNAALRMVAKLFMNTLYGQMLIGIFERSVTSVDNRSLERMYERADIEKINVIQVVNNRVYADITRTTESRLKKQGPFIVGAHVLGWSQMYMFEKLFSRLPRQYIKYKDTDAGKSLHRYIEALKERYQEETIEVWQELKDEFPEMGSARLYYGEEGGCFEEELPENAGAILVAKKTYCVYDKDKKVVAMGAKGIRRTDVVLTDEDVESILEFVRADDFEGRNRHCRDLYHSRPTVQEKGYEFFLKILEEGEGHVLSSSLLRIVGNAQRNVVIGQVDRYQKNMLSLMQNYSIKKISCTAHAGIRPGERAVVGLPLGEEEGRDFNVDVYDAAVQERELDDEIEELQDAEGDVEIEYI